jgi:hypothetical protein
MPTKPNSKVDFRDLELKSQISSRYPNKSEGLMTKRDLKRYYQLLSIVLKGLNFNLVEASWIVESFEGKAINIQESSDLLPVQNEIVAAIFFARVKTEPNLNKDSFLEKVKNWEYPQLLAISDAVERYWSLYSNQEDPDTPKILREVGLVK